TSTSNRFSSSKEGKDSVASALYSIGLSAVLCLRVIDNIATLLASADLASFDTDGFTLNFIAADATARVINFMALGGSGLTNAVTGDMTTSASTGAQAVTGVGFKPDCVIFFTTRTAAAPVLAGGTSETGQIGFAVSSTQRGVTAQRSNGGNPTEAKGS